MRCWNEQFSIRIYCCDSGAFMITRERLIDLVLYDPITGQFVWRYSRKGHIKQYEPAGSLDNQGYWSIRLDKKWYGAHRLAWLYVYGEWPDGEIDHQNMKRDDNRINNLRDATHGQNQHNGRVYKNSLSQTKGVTLLKSGRWLAQIQRNKRHIYLGTFPTRQLAHDAYVEAAETFFGEFARG